MPPRLGVQGEHPTSGWSAGSERAQPGDGAPSFDASPFRPGPYGDGHPTGGEITRQGLLFSVPPPTVMATSKPPVQIHAASVVRVFEPLKDTGVDGSRWHEKWQLSRTIYVFIWC